MPQTPSLPAAGQAWRLPDRVAYVVSHSYPWSSNGYAERTHAVARALVAAGHEVVVFNRPGRPWDIEGFKSDTDVALDQTLDGVRYVVLPLLPRGKRTRQTQMENTLAEAFAVFRPAMVLAASNWENAEPAQMAAARADLPFFYEQRGFWEMSGVAADPGSEADLAEAKARLRETKLAQTARAVFTLNEAMRGELIRRGVPDDRIHLVPNGVALPGTTDRTVTRKAIGSRAAHLVGYIGSLSPYEGIEDVLHLVARLRSEGVDAAAMIVGSSAPKGLIGSNHDLTEETRLRALAGRLGLHEFAHFVPQVPETKVGSYYPLCDVIVLPRRRTRVTELVPPIKPYTAATYGVPVFMTDLPPLAEIAAEIDGSLFAEGDLAGLAAAVRAALLHGHASSQKVLSPALYWAERVKTLSHHLHAASGAERARLADLMPAGGTQAAVSGGALFDLGNLPLVGLQALLTVPPVACVGPGAALAGAPRFTRLTRQTLLEVLASAEPGRFVIDWAGLQADPGEWAGLWSIDTMRLNRQIMDACRIALDRGWTLQVIGPVHRSRAPLFRTVARVMEEILPGQALTVTDGTTRETA